MPVQPRLSSHSPRVQPEPTLRHRPPGAGPRPSSGPSSQRTPWRAHGSQREGPWRSDAGPRLNSNWATPLEATLSRTRPGGASGTCARGPPGLPEARAPDLHLRRRLSAGIPSALHRGSTLSQPGWSPTCSSPYRTDRSPSPCSAFSCNDLMHSLTCYVLTARSSSPDNEATENPGLPSWGVLTCSRGSGSSSSPRFSLGYPLSPPFSESCGGKVTQGASEHPAAVISGDPGPSRSRLG